MARIVVTSPEGQQEFTLLDHNTLGRHPDNTVQILDRIVSKEHCHIDLMGADYVLKDLGSLNGTYVNGERVKQQPLKTGDTIQLGATSITFLAETPAEVASQFARTAPSLPLQNEPPTTVAKPNAKVTIAQGMVESHIRTKIVSLGDQKFLPEQLVHDPNALRADYEKLRASYELARAIGVELDVDKLLAKILDSAFQSLPADRGVILLFDEVHELKPRCVRTKDARSDDEVVLSTTIINEVLRDKAAVLSSDATVDSRFQAAHSIIMQGIRSSMAVPLLYSNELLGIMLLDSQVATNAFTEKDLQLFQNIANQAALSIQNGLFVQKLEEEAITRKRFQRLLSPAIAEQVLSGKLEVKKGGELRETTTMFTDIRGFTTMSESRDPQYIVDMLNEYFERMVEIIFKYEGTLDKFVGDAIMALFGSPVGHGDDPYRAVKTAIEMLDALEDYNLTRISEGEEPIQVGIGINSGPVVAGYLGSSKALEYTAIGDVVNTSARLCSIAKGGQIIVSENTYERIKGHFNVEELPAVQVKGKSKPVKIYNVIGELPT